MDELLLCCSSGSCLIVARIFRVHLRESGWSGQIVMFGFDMGSGPLCTKGL